MRLCCTRERPHWHAASPKVLQVFEDLSGFGRKLLEYSGSSKYSCTAEMTPRAAVLEKAMAIVPKFLLQRSDAR